MMKKLKLGLLGCGNIAKEVVKAINEGKIDLEITSLFDVNEKNLKKLFKQIRLKEKKEKSKPKIAKNIEDFLENVEIVLEAASQSAVKEYAKKILSSKKQLMIMSVGALVDDNFRKDLEKIAKENKVKIYIPSGAILGLDGLKAAKIGKINSVGLITRKPPYALGLDSKKIKKEIILYKGTAREAVKKFPQNINVAATLSLSSSLGFEKTKVKIITDPKIKENVHEISVKGEFGDFFIKTRNLPSKENPKTSYLAVLSAITTLKKISEEREGGIFIGG